MRLAIPHGRGRTGAGTLVGTSAATMATDIVGQATLGAVAGTVAVALLGRAQGKEAQPKVPMAQGVAVLAARQPIADVGAALVVAVVPALGPTETWLGPDAPPVPGRQTKTLQVPAATVRVVVLLQAATPLLGARVNVKA